MTWQVFHTTPNPTGQELDDNLSALARMGAYPCTVTGTANAIVLTLADTGAPPNSAYQNYQEYGFIAGSTCTSAVTIRVGSLAVLNAYKDTAAGPVALASSEIAQNCAYIAMYDLALNSGAGGFHVRAASMVTNSPINPSTLQIGATAAGTLAASATITRMLSGFATVTYTVIPANSTQTATVALTGAQIADLVMLGMPSTLTTGLMFDGRVLASGSIGLRAANVTAASIAAFSVTAHFGVMGVTP